MKVYLIVRVGEEMSYVERAFSKRESADKYLTSMGFEDDGEDYYSHPLDGEYSLNGNLIEVDEWILWHDDDPRLENVKFNNLGLYRIEEMNVE